MGSESFAEFPWIRPWIAISDRGRIAYEHELSLELTPDHPLFGVRVTAWARTCVGDDILFQLHEHHAELAVVHLTFTGRKEHDGRWPTVTFYSNLDHWVIRGMLVDAADFESDQSAA